MSKIALPIKLNFKQIILGITFIILLLGMMLPASEHITPIQQRSLALLCISILLWSTEALPIGISSLLIIGLQLLLQLAGTFAESVEGFLSSAIYFILAVTLFNQVMIKVGLDRVFARHIMGIARGNVQRTAVVIVLAVMVLPIFLPSAVSRLRMFSPLIAEINARYGLEKDSNLVRFCLWCFGGLNQVSTLVVLTGGGFAILASQIIAKSGEQVSWLQWFMLMAPPVYLSVILTSIIMWFYWKVGGLRARPLSNEEWEALETVKQQAAAGSSNRFQLLFAASSLVIVLILWAFGSQWGIPSILPPLIALGVLALPGINLVDDGDLRRYEWDSFIFIGSALSLSTTLERNGTVDWVAQHLFTAAASAVPLWVGILFFGIYVLLLRAIFVSPSSAMTVVLPLALSYGTTIGLDSLDVLLTAIMLISSVVILPVHSPTMFIAYQSGFFTMKDQWLIGSVLIGNVCIASLLASWLLW